jgi:hypothetical protein
MALAGLVATFFLPPVDLSHGLAASTEVADA